MEEAAEIEALQRGDAKAFEALVAKHHRQVYQTCLGFVFAKEEAEDLCQEVFVEVFRSISTFEGRSKLSTWMHRIAVTKSLEHLRSQKRKKRAAQLLSIFGLQMQGWQPSADPRHHPGLQMEHQEMSAALYAAIDALPESQRACFVLCKIEGKSYEEVAEILGSTVSSVESLMFRARKNLQKGLRKIYEQG